MDSDNALNVQNGFLNQVRKDRARVTLLLNNGQRIAGLVKSFDKFTLLLDTKQGDCIVFKHAIATVSPFRPPESKDRAESRPTEERQRPEKGFGNYMEFERKKE